MNKTNFLRLWLAAFLCFVAVRAVAAEPEPQAVASPSEPPLSEFNTNWQNLVEVETMPTNGIFWSASSSLPPTPFYPVTAVFPIYEFGTNDNYVYDDRGYDWTRYWEDLSGELPNRTAHLRENSAGRTRMDDPAPGSGSGQSYAITTNYLNYTNFWLSITNDPGNAWVSIESTLPGFWYGIATNGDLSTTNWGVWTNLLASNSITLAPPMALNSGPMFFQAVLLGYLGANHYYPGPYSNGAPFITMQPISQIVDVLNSATFSVAAIGSPPLSCQWQFDGTNIAGATASSYTIPYVEETNVGWYVAVVSNAFGTVTSAVATLTTFTSPPVIIAEPTNVAVYDGDPAFFSVTAIGPPTLAYQWNFNGTNVSGATNSTLSIPDVQATNAGSYFVIVTNSFGCATSVVATLTRSNRAPVFVYTPISQTVVEGDTVTFAARAIGTEPISYQWLSNGTVISGQTYNRYVDLNMQYGDEGTYAVIVSNPVGTNSFTNAILYDATADYDVFNEGVTPVFGPRQDYTFQSGNTYYIFPSSASLEDEPTNVVDLYGTTTIQGGAVIKFDYDEFGYDWWGEQESIASLVLHGSLVCATGPYNPAVLTSVDDDSQGEQPWVWWGYDFNMEPPDVSSSYPAAAGNGCAYLNLDDVHSTNVTSISNLRFCYADQAVTTPTNTSALEVWNCQFLECNSALNSRLANGASTNSLHNVLFSDCATVINAQTNLAELDGEQVTADAWSFWNPNSPPGKVCLTNSIVIGEFGRGVAISNRNVMVNPGVSPFQWGDDASYYLAPNSVCRAAGTTNISAPMRQMLRQKTTSAPISISGNFNIEWVTFDTFAFNTGIAVNEMTFFPVAKRYATNDAPDLGFYYDALDYTVAAMFVTNSVTVLPGTVIGFRNDFLGGFFLQDGSSLTAQGTPTNPIIFTDIQFVQEGPLLPGQVYQPNPPDWSTPVFMYGGIDFICPEAGTNADSVAPTVNLRFCNFHSTADDFPLWAGELEEQSAFCYSWASSVYWTMRDCTLQGGQIVLGQPLVGTPPDFTNYAAGAVSWTNNLFNRVAITLDPSYRTNDGWSGNDGVTNLDLPFYACNNTFTGQGFNATYEDSQVDIIIPIPTSKGNWVFRNNLFDSVTIIQETNQPIDADHNGYWCAKFNEAWSYAGEAYYSAVENIPELSSSSMDGNVLLTASPSYQIGPFGNHYMAPGTVLANAGSTSAGALGLYEYTTETNEVAQANSIVDIGLHYLAASNGPNGWVPLGSNPGEIPTYVQDVNGNGTIPSGANNPSNVLYANIDLDGDGMVGAVETLLGTDPLLYDNPLALISTGYGTTTAYFEVAVSGSLVHSNGQLVLMADGLPAATNSATDGNCVLAWNTASNIPGQSYYLQAHLILNGSGISADGPLLLFNQPAIAIQPAYQTNGLGGSVTFTTTNGGPGPYSYQWQLDGTNIAGATASSLTIDNLALTNAGDYAVIVSDEAGDPVESPEAILVVSNIGVGITTQPMSQSVYEPDIVTFAVTAIGTNLTYQWRELDTSPYSGTFGAFTNIPNATCSNYTISHIQSSDAGTYAVLVAIGTNAGGTNAILSAAATLTDEGEFAPYMPVIGPRQNYTFRGDATYIIGDPFLLGGAVDLYGRTTFEGGTVIKFNFDGGTTNAGLIVHGSLDCKTGPYRPATLTTIDDGSQGQWFNLFSPQTATVGTVYLNLDDAHSPNSISISNFRFFYADQAVTTPTNSGVLEVWDSQFCDCNSGVNSRLSNGCSTNRLHNVLFSGCDFAVAAQNACAEVDAEQVTAYVASFCDSEFFPSRLCMTNCIIVGAIGDCPAVLTQNVATPSAWPFQTVNDGNYYLPASSPYRSNGTVNITPAMLALLTNRTTTAPISFPTNLTVSGQMTLFPQAARYRGGAPDLGYAYPPLDYTMADLLLSGSITVLRGTAIGFRNDYFCGIGLGNNSSFVSQGTPVQPITFADNTLVQEGPYAPGEVFNQYASPYVGLLPYGGPAFFNPLPFQNDNSDAAPQMTMRFCNFYMTQVDYGVAAGYSQPYGGGFSFSYASSVIWNMQDCDLYGGQIILGGEYQSTNNSAGSVTWTNNLFDETFMLLQPSASTLTNTPSVDLAFFADNNLFKEGVLAVDPIPTSQGYWQFKNNLFDDEGVWQNTGQLLDFDYNYNGWWPNSGGYNFIFGPLASGLTPAQTDDGSTDGSNDKILTNSPPYQSGPFGKYYMASNTVLANAGSTTADQLGFYHYTTATNQFAQSNSTIDIGLHYLAASNGASGWVPLDTDGDGIPDYVEDATGTGATGASAIALGKTDWTTQYTVAGVWDPTNSIYDDIDLSGDGLVGRIKKALGVGPFDPSNPLLLTQVITGQEPDIATFEIPISYILLTNIGSAYLEMNGLPVTLAKCIPATNGSSLIVWNTTYDPPYQHYLQAQLSIYGAALDTSISTGVGFIQPYYSSNVLQFFESGSMYNDSLAYLDAQLPASNASYTIDVYDPTITPPTLLISITNTTTNGMIQEDWNLTCRDGVTHFTGNTADAVFHVTLLDPGSGTSTKHLVRATNGLTEVGVNFDSTYFYSSPISFNTGPAFGPNGDIWSGMLNVVDVTTGPFWAWPVYNSAFDQYSCFDDCESFPGYLFTQAIVTNSLYPDMAGGYTKQFYCSGHGGPTSMACYAYAQGDPFAPHILSEELTNLLCNNFDPTGKLSVVNPYRFVFLDGCFSAARATWSQTFGIYPLDNANIAGRNNVGPQAFVGWKQQFTGWITCANVDVAVSYTQTLAEFYADWMNGFTVIQCIIDATNNAYGHTPFMVPGHGWNQKIVLSGPGNDGRPPYNVTNFNTPQFPLYVSPIYVIGHSGLTVDGWDSSQDGFCPPLYSH